MSRNSIKKLRWGGRVLLVLYLACLIYFMFFSKAMGERRFTPSTAITWFCFRRSGVF